MLSDDIRQWAGPISPPSAAELADRYAIGQLCHVYALGIDMRDKDLLLSVFDPDGVGEGVAGNLGMKDYLVRTYDGAAAFSATQHTILNQHITVDGDEALLWSYGVAHHIRAKDGPEGHLGNLIVGVQYRDICHRGPKGWIIHRRKAVVQWIDGVMPGAKA